MLKTISSIPNLEQFNMDLDFFIGIIKKGTVKVFKKGYSKSFQNILQIWPFCIIFIWSSNLTWYQQFVIRFSPKLSYLGVKCFCLISIQAWDWQSSTDNQVLSSSRVDVHAFVTYRYRNMMLLWCHDGCSNIL